MTMLRIKKITLDKKLQMRTGLSQDKINEYCEAHIHGDIFPNIVVFKDNKTGRFLLADGWHRLKAAEKAKITEMECDLIEGSFRDALKFALSANSKHGINLSNGDKRKIVQICMADKVWRGYGARGIARLCGVSHHLVNTIYKEIAAEKAKKEKQKAEAEAANKSGINSTNEKKGKGKQSDTVSEKPKSGFETSTETEEKPTKPKKSDKYEPPEGMKLVEIHSYQEMLDNYKETLDENVVLHKMIDSDEPMKVAAAEIKKLNSTIQIMKTRAHGLMTEKNEALKMVKSHKAVMEKLKKQLKAAGVTEDL